ncbi:MAG TPA: DUF924 family protein [Mariprofundaceae bacterium]|nr:DUF924 family protein [Mariprofundaceae bacterium]
MSETLANPEDIIRFWFSELEPMQWFKKDLNLDQDIKAHFSPTHRAASLGELEPWRSTPEGRLAEIIVLDQFSRNIYRDTPLAFACDPMALVLAQEAIRIDADQKVAFEKRSFFYMPYMHSESAKVHEWAVELFSQPGAEFQFEFELKHKAIIDGFGRYPHRNEILGRTSTPKEIEFLKQPDSSF